MNCIHCGAAFKRIQYQRRAADEASEVVTLCPKCPLDMERAVTTSNVIVNMALNKQVFEYGEYLGPGLTAPSDVTTTGLGGYNMWHEKCLVTDPTGFEPANEYEISHGEVGAAYDSIFAKVSRRGSVRRVLSITKVVFVPYRNVLVQGISRDRVGNNFFLTQTAIIESNLLGSSVLLTA